MVDYAAGTAGAASSSPSPPSPTSSSYFESSDSETMLTSLAMAIKSLRRPAKDIIPTNSGELPEPIDTLEKHPSEIDEKFRGCTHKVFLLTNYILLGAASNCIFLTLSLIGALLVLLHIITIAVAISGCVATSHGGSKSYGAHMVATVLTTIFQGSVSILIFTRPYDFLGHLKSYVREQNGIVILKFADRLCVLIFCLKWVVLMHEYVLFIGS
ncbi:hypothetical protein OROMI_028935 [Orobanche minor]